MHKGAGNFSGWTRKTLSSMRHRYLTGMSSFQSMCHAEVFSLSSTEMYLDILLLDYVYGKPFGNFYDFSTDIGPTRIRVVCCYSIRQQCKVDARKKHTIKFQIWFDFQLSFSF